VHYGRRLHRQPGGLTCVWGFGGSFVPQLPSPLKSIHHLALGVLFREGGSWLGHVFQHSVPVGTHLSVKLSTSKGITTAWWSQCGVQLHKRKINVHSWCSSQITLRYLLCHFVLLIGVSARSLDFREKSTRGEFCQLKSYATYSINQQYLILTRISFYWIICIG